MEIDEAILKQVKAALARETHLDPQAHPVALEAIEGRLLIEGEVPDVAAKKRALRAAAAVLGAGDAIVDRLRVVHTALLASTSGRLELVEPAAAPLGDPTLLGEILGNLVENALHYRRAGVPPVVRVTAEEHDGHTNGSATPS